MLQSTNSQPIVLNNNGNATLTFSQITVSGTGFGQTGLTTSTTVAAGTHVTFNATFSPTATGAVTGSITLNTNAASPLVINLSGTGQSQTVTLGTNPTSLAFGSVLIGTNSQKTVTITNTGNSAVAGANVSIASNATNSPTVVTLTGSGQHNVLLNWGASSTSGVTYSVFRGTTAGGEGTTPIASGISALTYTDTNVTAGTTYFYTVEAVNAAGSQRSFERSVGNRADALSLRVSVLVRFVEEITRFTR